jgi:hypothetical protein
MSQFNLYLERVQESRNYYNESEKKYNAFDDPNSPQSVLLKEPLERRQKKMFKEIQDSKLKEDASWFLGLLVAIGVPVGTIILVISSLIMSYMNHRGILDKNLLKQVENEYEIILDKTDIPEDKKVEILNNFKNLGYNYYRERENISPDDANELLKYAKEVAGSEHLSTDDKISSIENLTFPGAKTFFKIKNAIKTFIKNYNN